MKHLNDYLRKSVELIIQVFDNALKFVAMGIIQIYRLLFSPLMGTNCRFYPTCSHYAEEAFHKFNFFTALGLTIKRLLACRPFGREGYDPIPRRKINVTE